MKLLINLVLLLLVSVAGSLNTRAAEVEALNLRTEQRINPEGIETSQPGLSWQIKSDQRNVLQTAWQVQSAFTVEDMEAGKLFWDSGKIISEQSHLVNFDGPELHSSLRVYWKVRVWDNLGNESGWSQPAYFEMGLLKSSDWKARWIEPHPGESLESSTACPYLRKEFRLKKEVQKAQLYVTCHGLYEVHLNGKKVGDQLFTPGWTSYTKRLQYQVYDVKNMLKKGDNAIGTILGEGWFCGPFGWEGKKQLYGNNPALLLQLKISYSDGSSETIISDKSWKSSTGPILKSEIYDGETYDARLEPGGWDLPGYKDRNWIACSEKDYGFANIVSSDGVPVRVTETLHPVQKLTTPEGDLVFDFGQNMVGWVKFSLEGEKGSSILLQHAEVLDQDGNFYTDNLRSAKQEIRYTFKGEGVETFEPHFTFQGFRYLKISDYTGTVSLDDLEGKVIHSDMERSGDFHCSDSLINRLQKNILWGLRGNFLDVPTDCPQRDERMGWTGDAQVFTPTACFNMNTAAFFSKWMKDLAADQLEDGSVPWVVPMVVDGGGGTGWSEGYGATGWADAAVTIPWTLYQSYGDLRILDIQYPSMKAWVDYMIKHAGERYIFDYGFHFGDWLSFAEYYSLTYNAPDFGFAGAHTDKDLIATAYFYHSTSLIQKTAALLGKLEDADLYAGLLPKIKKAFQTEFMTSSGRLSSNTQTAYALALEFNLLPDEYRQAAAKRLAENVDHFGHLTTGFLGTPLLCHALSNNSYSGHAYKLLFQEKYPSWLYPVTMGATTIWERWDGIRPDGSFQDVGMNSFNHYAYGAIGNWLYQNVAGIQSDPENPGYKKIFIKPLLNPGLDHVNAWHNSPYGKIISSWKTIDNRLELTLSIPPNSRAVVHLPADSLSSVTESGIPLEKIPDIKVLNSNKNHLVLEIGSGNYRFESKLK